MENKAKFKPDPNLQLMDQVRQVLRYHHYSYRTEQTYTDWILRFIKFHGSQMHPLKMGKPEVEAFLSHLATNRRVAASTQRQALNALIFLYRQVLDKPIEDKIEPVKANNRPLLNHMPSAPRRDLPRCRRSSVFGRQIGGDSPRISLNSEAWPRPSGGWIQNRHHRRSHHSRWVPE